MPQIPLRYVGDDEKMKQRLARTDGVQWFEPVDAKEVLAMSKEDRQYEIIDDSRKMMGKQFDPREMPGSPNVPQLQGADAELQTGLSHEKYGRSQVVKAIPEALQPSPGAPQSTTGRPLDMNADNAQAYSGRMVAGSAEGDGGEGGAKRSEGMTRDEILSELDAHKESNPDFQFNRNARKDELAETLDRIPSRKGAA